MKRLLCMILTGLMLFSAAACTAAPEPSGTSHTPDPVKEPDDAPDAGIPAIGGYADFVKTLSAALVDGTTNKNLSPISVYLALAMVTEGAVGDTQADLLKLLGCESIEQLRGVCGEMLNTLKTDAKDCALEICDSIWMAKEINGMPAEFHEDFLGRLAEIYRSEANTVEFGTQSAAKQIADWITEHTHGKIKISEDAMQFDPGTLAVLINTIYLKDGWAETFDGSRTEPGVFAGLDGETKQPKEITVDYMSRFDKNATITQGDGWLRYRVYLRNVGYVSFVLPDEGISLDHLLGSPDALQKLLTAGIDKSCDVSLRIPKFSFQDKTELTDVLKALGLARCFGGDADFSGMSDLPCTIDRVLQESYIGVDEYGVEAAAYTMVMMKNTAFNPVERERVDFHLTRPFLYTIESRDGTVLFIGTVTAPTASAAN